MLIAAALLLALAGSGAFAGSGGSSPSSDESTGLSRDAPAAGATGFTHRGRHCHHGEGRQAPQQSPTEQPPV
jgi:hypothetical protein